MLRKFGRGLKYKYFMILRNKGASTVVARSFAIGMFIEFITLPTFGLAFLLLFPLIRLTRGLFSVALIAFAIGKALVPFFLVLNYHVGSLLLVHQMKEEVSEFHFSLHTLKKYGLTWLVGSGINGFAFSVLCYGLVYWTIVSYKKRKELRRYQRSVSAG